VRARLSFGWVFVLAVGLLPGLPAPPIIADQILKKIIADQF
jgi:hypothetical protein